jgi:hypothetical protein
MKQIANGSAVTSRWALTFPAIEALRISFPDLKNGKDFSSTAKLAPLRGLRPVRARRLRTENTRMSLATFPLAPTQQIVLPHQPQTRLWLATKPSRAAARRTAGSIASVGPAHTRCATSRTAVSSARGVCPPQ